jgi:hypothetical protein
MSEWEGDIDVDVIDMDGMDAEFDVILGLPWHKENRPVVHWDSLIYEVEQGGEKRKIFPSLDSKIIDIDISEASLNIIDERRAKKLLLKQETEFAVYYNRLIPAAAEPLATVQDGPEVPEHSAELKELLREYKDLFRSSLPDALPPRRDVEHEIETGDASPVNTRAYPLSAQQLKE